MDVWNVKVSMAQLADAVTRLTEDDHRRAVVDTNGPGLLEQIDNLAAALADAREAQRKALFDLGY